MGFRPPAADALPSKPRALHSQRTSIRCANGSPLHPHRGPVPLHTIRTARDRPYLLPCPRMASTTVVVLGGGNTAFSVAAKLSLEGHKVVLWEAPEQSAS